jgi:hypothetical protein
MRQVKAYARRHDLTITAVMERALAAYLASAAERPRAPRLRLPAFGSGGARPGVQIDDTSALLELMDGVE